MSYSVVQSSHVRSHEDCVNPLSLRDVQGSSSQHNTPLEPIKPAGLQPIKPADKPSQVDALLLAYYYLFESVQTEQQSARIQAKGLRANALAQNKLIADEAMDNFANFRHSQLFTIKKIRNRHSSWTVIGKVPFDKVWYTTKMVTADKPISPSLLEGLQTHNQEISAARGIIEDQLTVLRQGAQIKQTNLNSSVDENQQSTQEGASLMQMLTQLTNQISRI